MAEWRSGGEGPQGGKVVASALFRYWYSAVCGGGRRSALALLTEIPVLCEVVVLGIIKGNTRKETR